jgi:nitrogenase-associated protein
MATVNFYEKPGCANNTRQKKLLTEAGHALIAHDLLKETWTGNRLRKFFGQMPVAQWFNHSAPAVKYGEIEPDKLTEHEALELMLESPLLIRRPLMQVGEEYMAGFDPQKVDAWIGLKENPGNQDVETCTKNHDHPRCHHE